MKQRLPNYIAAAVILCVGLLLGLRHIGQFPAYIHAWSQADWYAISIGFLNNDFNFFHPETLIYNKQYPGWWAVDYGDTITSVDFPIHNYIVALLMKLFGTTAPWVFRLWTMICSLVGAWFLYLLAHRLTKSTLKSLTAVIVFMTAPVYAYYFASFLPSAPALALVVAGLWAYIRHWQGDGVRWWHWSITLLGLATLVRTSHAVVLVAVCGFEMIRIMRTEEKMQRKWLSVAIAFVAIMAYHFWNKHLAALHGTIFLGELRTPESWTDAHNLWGKIKDYWQWQYFSRLQHRMIALTIIAAVVVMGVRYIKKEITPKNKHMSLGWLIAIYFLGEICFFAAMMVQYEDHDYYFLDSFFIPCILLFIVALRNLPPIKGHLITLLCIAALVVIGGLMVNNAKHNNQNRCKSDDRAYKCSLNYAGADQWLDNIGVSRDAKILSIFSYPQNAPFIQMGRKGYSLMWYDTVIIDSAMHFPFDYAVIEDDVFRDNFQWQQRILSRLTRICGNGRLSLCRLEDSVVNQCVDDFFQTHGYVGLHEGTFWLNGERWFPMMLNYKAEMHMVNDRLEVTPASWYTGSNIREHFDTIAAWGFNAVRVCLDVLDEREDTAAMFRATRHMILQADSAGLHVMLLIKAPFEGYWRDYAIGLMHTLSDMPALWAYDLMNEPLYFDPEPNRTKKEAVRIVDEWRCLVRTHAPRQLFTVATAEPIEVFEWDPSMLPVDFIEMHTYHPLRVPSEMWWYSHYCGKPWMIGETGLPADGDSIPYKAQMQFMQETYRYARQCDAIGYGWWEFQDCPNGVNFEAQYTGLRDRNGHRKVICLPSEPTEFPEYPEPPANYYNMLAYINIAVTGRVIDNNGNPVEGAVIRGWNDNWSVGMNTYSDSTGHFRLVSNDICTHFEISAPHHSKVKFDRRLSYPANLQLPDRNREYQQLPLLGWGDKNNILPINCKNFSAPNANEASLGIINIGKIK